MLEVKGIKVNVADTEIIHGVSLTVKKGAISVVMGPNGSGKSSLSYAISGHPHYETTSGKVTISGKDITGLPANERSEAGLYLAMQSPIAIQGLVIKSFLWQLYQKHRINDEKFMELPEFERWLRVNAAKVQLDLRLLDRSLNDGFSGGEKKKLEILQLLTINPKIAIIDEIDSGLDVDALRAIAQILQDAAKGGMSLLVITHYPRLLEYLEATDITVLKAGLVAAQGGKDLIANIEKNGYKSI